MATADEQQKRLVAAARQAAERAHCPYSHFPVGAAVLTAEGEVVPGCNVESASYGLSCCAERVALFSTVARGLRPLALAVSCVGADSALGPDGRMPCGACRQIIADLMPPGAPVYVDGVGAFTVEELLPRPFRL